MHLKKAKNKNAEKVVLCSAVFLLRCPVCWGEAGLYVDNRGKVYRYLLRSTVVRTPHKAYRSPDQDTMVVENRNHYDLHQFDKKIRRNVNVLG